MPKTFVMTNTELKLKRKRMEVAFAAGKAALEALNLRYFLTYLSAQGVLCEGQFRPQQDDVQVGIYAWELAGLQRTCAKHAAAERDDLIRKTFATHGLDPLEEYGSNSTQSSPERSDGNDPPPERVCPRVFLAEGWSEGEAFPIIYKFVHRDSGVRFHVINFTLQYGCLWDFSDGGAETSSGWRYTLFSPQPVEFDGVKTYTMPVRPLRDHYGQDWHTLQVDDYIESLSRCLNRCQVLRVYPFAVDMPPPQLLDAMPWDMFRVEVHTLRKQRAKALIDSPYETPPKELDLHKMESKPLVLFEAAGICKADGNELLRNGSPQKAIAKYDEGLYIIDKAREVLLTWRVVFRAIYVERAEKDKKERGLNEVDFGEEEVPREFRNDENDERNCRLALLLNASQAALLTESWSTAEARADNALEVDDKNLKALYRRGLAKLRSGRIETAKADFWAVMKFSDFTNKEALQQLLSLNAREDVQKEIRRLKAVAERERRIGAMLTSLDEDQRIRLQEERHELYMADSEQRRLDGNKKITFDEWAQQYEWRYDAEQRSKMRDRWPACFSQTGPSPLPVEDWEIDYLTYKEIDKIMYHRQTAAMGARRRAQQGHSSGISEKEGFTCKLEVDPEDEEFLRDAVVQKGYKYWW